MTTRCGYALVEGHGEVAAVANLLTRLWFDLALPYVTWKPLRWPKLHLEAGVRSGANYVRSKPDVAALLILRDEDDRCPRDEGPRAAAWLAAEALPFPSAVTLFYREYEVLFLACIAMLAGQELDGRPGIRAGATYEGIPQDRRGAKEWLTRHYDGSRAYKPTTDQLALTRMLDFEVLRTAEGVPCFATLERALRSLGESIGRSSVYPFPTTA